MGLSHFVQHCRGAMLGGNFKLTADMVSDELLEEILILVTEHVVKADT